MILLANTYTEFLKITNLNSTNRTNYGLHLFVNSSDLIIRENGSEWKLEDIIVEVCNNNNITICLELAMILFDVVPQIVLLLSKYNLEQNVIFLSSSTFVLQYLRYNFPSTPIGRIVYFQQSIIDVLNISDNIDYMIIDHKNLIINPDFLDGLSQKNIKVGIFGIDSGDGITSNELPAILADHSAIELVITHNIVKSMAKL